MATQNNIRIIIPVLMQKIQVLYQNGEIDANQKNQLCSLATKALQTKDLSELNEKFKAHRYGSLFPDVVEECIQMTNG